MITVRIQPKNKMEEDEEKVMINKASLDRLLGQYEKEELEPELFLLDEDDEARAKAFCNRQGYLHFKQWLLRQSALVASSKGNLTPKPKKL